MADQIIDRLGVEFFSKLDPNFGSVIQQAVADFEKQIRPLISQLNRQFKDMAINVTTFFEILKNTPAIDLGGMVNLGGLKDTITGTFKSVRAKSKKEFEGLSSDIEKEANKLEKEFKKIQGWIAQLRGGINPVESWGETEFRKGKGGKAEPYWPNKQYGIPGAGPEVYAGGMDPVTEAAVQEKITEYRTRQLEIYKQMENLVGRMGAFEKARLAADELIAQQLQKEAEIRERIAKFAEIANTLINRGMAQSQWTGERVAGFTKDMEAWAKQGATQEEIYSEIDRTLISIVGSEEKLQKVTMDILGIQEKMVASEAELLEIAKKLTEQYEQAKKAAMAGPVMGGGAGQGLAQEWDRLIGVIFQAKDAVSQFQQKLQQINLRAFIKGDEFARIQNIGKAMNAEIDSLIRMLGTIGSHEGARKLAADFDKARKEITELNEAASKGTISDLDAKIQKLALDLRRLGEVARTTQLQAMPRALGDIDSQIRAFTGGVDLNYKSIRRLNLGTLELEKVQNLLKERLALTRQEFDLMGGKSTPALNARFKETSEAVYAIGHHLNVLTRGTADAARAADRWGVGFKDMLKSQLAWLLGGAVIFGIVFKIQQAFTETIKTIVDFKQAIIDVGAITEATGEEMVVLEKAARDVATSTKMGFMEAAEALKILGQAGMTAMQSAQALKTVAMLTTATGASTQEAVKVLTTAINVWNLSAKESTRVGNVLAAALNYSKLEIGDLATSFNYLAATSAQVGMSLEETVASIAVLSNAGVRASTIGTGLRGVISQLIAPTKQFKDELKAVGLSIEDVRMPGKNLIEVLNTLSKAGFNLGNIFEGLEKRQAAMLASMLNMGAAAFQRMTDRITGTNAMMVMFERSMEGPRNQLILMKNRLLDLGLDLTGVVIPGLKAMVTVVGAFVGALKDLTPVFAFIAALKLLSTAAKETTIFVDGLAVATTRLGAALNFLKTHPFLLAITAIVGGYQLVTWWMERENKAREQRIKDMDREIQETINFASSLESVKAAVTSKNVSELEAKRIVEGLSDKYKDIKDAAVQYGVKSKEFIDKVTESLDGLDKRLESMKLDRLAEEGKKYIEILNKLADAEQRLKDLQQKGEVPGITWTDSGFGQAEVVLKRMKEKVGADARSIRAQLSSARDVLEPFLRKYVEWESSTFKMAMAARGYNEVMTDQLDILRKEVGAMVAVENERKKMSQGQERDAAMEKALQRLREQVGSEYSKLLAEKERRLAEFTGKSKTAIEGQLLVEKWFQQELKKLDDKRERDVGKARLKELELDAKKAKGILKEEETIWAEYEAAILKLEEDYSQKRQAVRDREIKNFGYVREQGEEEINNLFQMEGLAREVAYNKAQREIIALAQKRTRETIKAEKESQGALTKIRRETLEIEVSLAKTASEQIDGQWKLRREKESDEMQKHTDRIKEIEADHMDEIGNLTGRGAELMEAETRRHYAQLLRIFMDFQAKEKEITDQAQRDRLQKIQKVMKAELEGTLRAQAELLLAMEKAYDELSEAERQSDKGKAMKAQIDRMTIEVYEKRKDLIYSYILALEAEENQTENMQTAIANLRQEFEKYNDKVRDARRSWREWNETQQSVWAGLKSGWREFTNTLANEFEIGRQLAKGFGEALFQNINQPLEDLFLNQLKSFKDYWRNFCTDLVRVMTRSITQMLFEWLGFRRMMQEGEFWQGGLGALLRGLFGWGAGAGMGGPGTNPGSEYNMGVAHQGGTVADILARIPQMHGGGTGLNRDEVLVRMLKDEYVLNSRATRMLGKQALDYMNKTGQIPQGGNQFSVNAQFVLNERNKKLESYLRSEMEATVMRVMREHV